MLKELRTGKETPFTFPGTVPVCGGDGSVERIPGTSAWRCKNRDSYEQAVRRFEHFVSKKAMHIDGLGTNIVALLLEKGLVTTPADLYTLTYGDLEVLPNFKEKSIQNILSAIEQSREVPLAKLLFGLSIDHVGQEIAHDLAHHFGSLKHIQNADTASLEAVEGVGSVVAESVYAWFHDDSNQSYIHTLTQHITIQNPKKQKKEGILQGKTVVVTGSLTQFTRDEVKELVRNEGGIVSSTVSKKNRRCYCRSETRNKTQASASTQYFNMV